LDAAHGYFERKETSLRPSVVVTLDDGFCDNYENAFPVLAEYRIPATIFLAVGCIGKSNTWMQKRGFSKREMLSWHQVGEMAGAGILFGAHTITHPRLIDLRADEARREIKESKDIIEERLGTAVESFAYPYGLFTDVTRNFVEDCGYSIACSTRSGFNNSETDPFLLRRIEVYGMDPLWKLSQKLTFGMNDASILYPFKYYWSRVRAHLS
jgi:peptidoglycan/xylan/chitin deacetylase (PgdA/CDA1 family)